MRKRVLFVLVVLPATILCSFPTAQGQDLLATNLEDLVEQAFTINHCLYMPFTAWDWQAYSTDGGQPWWIDCSQQPCFDLLPVSATLNGVSVYAVRLTKNVLTGETILQSDSATEIVAHIEAPSDYQPGAQGQDQEVWAMWQEALNCPECWGIEGEIPPPMVTTKVLLADLNDYATYAACQSNLDAMAEAEAAASASGSFAALPMDTGDEALSMDGLSCTVTDPAQPFAITSIYPDTNSWIYVEHESCTNFVYVLFSADSLDTPTLWQGITAARGQLGSSTFVDTNTPGVTSRFYKVLRIPDYEGYNGDAIPSGWVVDHRLNLLDPDLDNEDPDGDGFKNYPEYVADTDPLSSSSFFHITDIFAVGNDVWVFFTSAADRYYNLQRTDCLGCSYYNVVTNIPGNGGIQWAKDIGGVLAHPAAYRVAVFISTNIPPDSDGDSMPDLWTERYFGHPTGLAADLSRATDNPDGDCFNNLQEYYNVTDPTNSDPVATVGGGNVVCQGQTLNLLASPIPGATYSWTGPNGFSSTNQNASITNVSASAAGNYCVTAMSGSCAVTNCVTVTVHVATASVSGSNTICPGTTNSIQATLTGTGPWIVTWSDGVIMTNSGSTATRNVSPPTTTTYTVTSLSDALCSGGTASGSAVVTVNTNGLTTSVVVSNEVLVVYSSNIVDSISCKDYYIGHRPGFSNANVLGCSCTTTGTDGFESITMANLTNQIINPIISFIQSNATKSIHYVVLMYGMPSRVRDGYYNCSVYPPSVQHHISRCMSSVCNPSGTSYEGSTCPFVATNYPGTTCLVTALNMATLADCTAYVDKVHSMYTGNVIISAKAAGYSNDNYYLDGYISGSGGESVIRRFQNAILGQNPAAAVLYSTNAVISAGNNVKGYASWGVHNLVYNSMYPTNGSVAWSGSSTWWIIETIESFNGQRDASLGPGGQQPQGDVEEWFAPNAWGGTDYANTPVGAVSHVEEPYGAGVNGPTFMSLWEGGYPFAECAWASKNTACFQAIGDPLVKQ